MRNGAREELKKKISKIVDQKGGDIEAYKDVMNTTWRYLRHMLGFTASTLVMERALRIMHERFPQVCIDLTIDGPDLEGLENSSQNVDALKFCIDCVIEFMEKLAGDVLIKGLMKRLNHRKAPDEIP